MSTVSDRHSIIPATPTARPLTGQRLVRIGYKQTDAMTKRGETAPESKCVSVPPLEDDGVRDHLDRLMPYIRAWLESTQDAVIRNLLEDSEHGLKSVATADFDIPACISYLAALAAGDRLKKSAVETWFDTEVSDNLTVYLAEFFGFEELNDDQRVTVDKNVRAYRELLLILASGKTILTPKQIKGCRKVISLATTDDRISSKLCERLAIMERPVSQKYEALADIGD